MTQMFAAPGRYIQGYKELDRLQIHVAWFGRRLMVITTQGRLDSLYQALITQFANTKTELHFEIFSGEVTRQEIQRLTTQTRRLECDGVVGVGGGKVIDIAKAVANQRKLPLCIVPRSEMLRVGQQSRSRWPPDHEKRSRGSPRH